MKQILGMMMLMTGVCAWGYSYEYDFRNEPLADALVRMSREHEEINISLIYNDLRHYTTSARVRTDDACHAIMSVVGINPVTVAQSGNNYFVEALQHGKFCYTGSVAGSDGIPVDAAMVMLLLPKDSTVVTYGMTDGKGRFSIPCDKPQVIAKLSRVGYKTRYVRPHGFNMGLLTMQENAVKLKDVTVESDKALLYGDRSVFMPTKRQKNAAQDALDLLWRMSLPQLRHGAPGDNPLTLAGKPVKVYVDYLPAGDNELKGMRTADVQRVEYYDYPQDPRFGGDEHVVNFILVKYEYGGFAKGMVDQNVVVNSGSAQVNGKLQYKKMDYQLFLGEYYAHNRHFGADESETYRLPQTDGTVRVIDRNVRSLQSLEHLNQYWATFQATYRSEKVSVRNSVSSTVNHKPHSDDRGEVSYSVPEFGDEEFQRMRRANSYGINYWGNYYFQLPGNSSLVANPSFSYSHTSENSCYAESSGHNMANSAADHSKSVEMDARYQKQLGGAGSITLGAYGEWLWNRTRYRGSLDAYDRNNTASYSVSGMYAYSGSKIYARGSLRWCWYESDLNGYRENSSGPVASVEMDYNPDRHNSLSISGAYTIWNPTSEYKSNGTVQATPLMSYTGNPLLKTIHNYTAGLSYTWIQSKRFSMSAYGYGWITDDRMAYDYKASPTGILRTIVQPIGSYKQLRYGVNGDLNLLDDNLNLSGGVEHYLVHNGAPFNFTRSHVSFNLSANYYVGDFYFSGGYGSNSAECTGSMTGYYQRTPSWYFISAGWGNGMWNVRVLARNFTRWHWRGETRELDTACYSYFQEMTNVHSHAFFKLAATYTFGFGKKVSRSLEVGRGETLGSGILK